MVTLYTEARAMGIEYRTDCTIEPTMAESKAWKMAYNLRERSPKNYKELEKVDLPWAQRVKAADPTALYQVEVLERENERVKDWRYTGLATVTRTKGLAA